MAFDPEDIELIEGFLTESTELLDKLDEDLVALEKAPGDSELLNRAFRSIHTIKGSASFLGFDLLVKVAHKTEDVLNRLRKDEISLTPAIMDVILAATDAIKILIGDISNHELIDHDMSSIISALAPFLEVTLTKETQEAYAAADRHGATDETGFAAPAEESPSTETATAPATVAASATAQPAPQSTTPAAPAAVKEDSDNSTVRIDVKRLDDLMNQVGELVLERNRMAQLNDAFQSGGLEFSEDEMSKLTKRINFVTSELQTQVMKMRMIPVDKVFRKFPRMVRSLARELGKEIDLQVFGEETELDRSVVDEINDPLVHLIRNALDHGLEPPEERIAAGKPKRGSLTLSASHEGNQILISIKDDGRGLDPVRIGKKAIEKGLVSEEQVAGMSQKEIFELIFLPGFSTKDVASDVSGRGVGMDVVRTNLRKINGTVDIKSELGSGSEFILRLPLTLAIIQSLLVEVGTETYAVPLVSVLETLKVQTSSFRSIGSCEVLSLRNEVLPLVRLELFFNVEDAQHTDECNVVVVGVAGRKAGFIVSRLLGQQEVAIKSLGKHLSDIKGIAGSTILGDGRVALIVDPMGIINTKGTVCTRG